MINNISKTLAMFNFEAFSEQTIDISPESINKAVEFSLNIPNEQQQWRTYLNHLALDGFEEWLNLRASELTVNSSFCTILQPEIANVLDAVCNLEVAQFKLCLIATGSFTDEEITLPRAVVDLPEFIPHFYVIVEVQEEQETAVVQSFLSYEQLMQRRSTVNLEADQDWTYQVPLTWFEANPDHLLLFLRRLELTAISLPEIPSNRLIKLAEIRSELLEKLPQLQTSQLWQVLTWEQGEIVLTNCEILNWLYQLQRGEIISESNQTSLQNNLSDILQLLTKPAMNVGRWLFNELDEFAQELSWVLLPSIALTSPLRGMRTPAQEFEAIAKQLRHNSVEIPTSARAAYRDLQLTGIPLRLYAITWLIPSDSLAEWELLLILGAASGTTLPTELRLRVSDQSSVLVEQRLEDKSRESYLFTSVIGSCDEKFIVTVGLEAGIEETLPPFSFNPH
ncbi:MAG: DUF1822 family protein [Coleofasciculaceae cyanobacterium]